MNTVISIIQLAVGLICLVSLWKLFVKANQPGWACIVPIYNMIVLVEMIKKPIFWVVLFFIPFGWILVFMELAPKFGKTKNFGIGMALLPFIFLPLLAFSDATFNDSDDSVSAN